MPFLQRHLVGLETLSKKWRRKIRGQKAAKPSFSSHLFCSIRERESWRDERRETREGYAHGHTHTHRERESVFKERVRERDGVLLCARESYKREREIDAFFFLLCDGRTYPKTRERSSRKR